QPAAEYEIETTNQGCEGDRHSRKNRQQESRPERPHVYLPLLDRVAHAVHSRDLRRAFQLAKLAAQARQVRVKSVVVNDRTVWPGCLDQLASPHHLARP